MLTKADDFPVHQTPEPIAYAGSDRNFYDRYFFNGYDRDCGCFFAAALGVYPHLNVMDASFSVVHEGVQENLHASREMHGERIDTEVGPIRVEVVEPLRTLRVISESREHGMACDLVFDARAAAIEEPRFVYRQGPRTIMDYTRLTQSGVWSGWYEAAGVRVEVDPRLFSGVRDRSWGVRPVGAGDPQPVAPAPDPQFYWLWAPFNFEGFSTFFHENADAEGRPWNKAAVVQSVGATDSERIERCSASVEFRPGTRHARRATIEFAGAEGGATLEIEPRLQFYMSGLGYVGSEWAHGLHKGELAVGHDRYVHSDVDENDLAFLHVQALSAARYSDRAGGVFEGAGVLEQLVLGPHAPSGFKEFLDPAR